TENAVPTARGGPAQDRVVEHSADRRNCGTDLVFGGAYHPSVNDSRRLNGVGIRLQVDRCQERVHECAKAAPARPLLIGSLQSFDVNVRLITLAGCFGRIPSSTYVRGNGPHKQRRLGSFCEQRLALALPCSITPLAR